MLTDETITLRDTRVEELAAIYKMEHGEARSFILPYSLERHQEEFGRPTVVYRSIYRADKLVGFVILALDPDRMSVELRRIVISEPGRGIGKLAVEMVRNVCRSELGRTRLWLDVFERNERARHVYEECGYRRFGTSEHQGRTLLLYERTA